MMSTSWAGGGRVVLAGGNGFLGWHLAADLRARGCEVVVLTRKRRRRRDGVIEAEWDGVSATNWVNWVDGAAAVINLAGRSVNCRYTEANRREIVASRVDSVHALGEAIARARRPPAVWVQAGSLAIYGNAGDRLCDEDTPAGRGFSPDVCVAWEEAFAARATAATRKVFLRIGLVVARDGGALGTLLPLVRAGLGGAAGDGRQWVSWLHVHDFQRVVEWAWESPEAAGVYNACTPAPVRNAEWMRTLRAAAGRPWSPPVPAWAVRIGSRLLGTEPELALHGRRAVPRRLLAEGFRFDFTDLRECLESVLADEDPAVGSRAAGASALPSRHGMGAGAAEAYAAGRMAGAGNPRPGGGAGCGRPGPDGRRQDVCL